MWARNEFASVQFVGPNTPPLERDPFKSTTPEPLVDASARIVIGALFVALLPTVPST